MSAHHKITYRYRCIHIVEDSHREMKEFMALYGLRHGEVQEEWLEAANNLGLRLGQTALT